MTNTHCPYCALQCGMTLSRQSGQWEAAPRDFPTNRGGMCRKGWTSAQLLEHPERLTTPLLRYAKNEELYPVSWDEALEYIVGKWREIQAGHGRAALGVFGGGGLTNEKAYLLGKFARVALKTPNIDYNGRYCMASGAAAGIKAFGLDRGLPFPLEDIPHAKTVVLIGSNCAETMPPIMQWFEAQRENGGNLIVIDPRATPTAQNATLHLQITPGTDVALANGLLHIAIEQGRLDCDYILNRTSGFEEVRRAVGAYWPDYVERLTGVSVAMLDEVVQMISSGPTMFLTARGAEQQVSGTESVMAFINLALALGHPGRPFSGYGTLTGQGNGQGGREHGQKCDQLPGYRKIDDPQHRAEVAAHWGIAPEELPGAGRSAYEMLDEIGTENGIRGLLVMGSNLAVSSPRAGHIREKLKSLDLLVVFDLFLSETAQMADVVLPATQWAEEEGTMTNLEGRVLLRQPAKKAPDGVWSDARMLSKLASLLGCGEKFPSKPRAIFEELRRVTAGAPADYSGISYERIKQENGVFWPCSSENSPGERRIFTEKFAHPDGKARFHEIHFEGFPEAPDGEFPLFFTTGRVMAHYQSGTQTRRVRELNEVAPEPFVELNPALAMELGIEDGEPIEVSSRRGTANAVAKIVDTIRADTIFMPFHWGGDACANLLTLPELDPHSKMPAFKLCAARIDKKGAQKP